LTGCKYVSVLSLKIHNPPGRESLLVFCFCRWLFYYPSRVWR